MQCLAINGRRRLIALIIFSVPALRFPPVSESESHNAQRATESRRLRKCKKLNRSRCGFASKTASHSALELRWRATDTGRASAKDRNLKGKHVETPKPEKRQEQPKIPPSTPHRREQIPRIREEKDKRKTTLSNG